ncbi:MAG: hypothetical protein K6F00_02170 [Lachnospiraceae bacterium]|nr:hypothetical protein [Lachnospiraceae bacterium]
MTGADYLVEVIDKVFTKRRSNVDLGTPRIGMTVGKCKNCGSPAKIRQPWLSKMEVVNDDCYLIHCSNEDCHNYYGMEIGLGELYLVDFIEWDEEFIIKEEPEDGGDRGKIIRFEEREKKRG